MKKITEETWCDICKREIKEGNRVFTIVWDVKIDGREAFSMQASETEYGPDDVCRECLEYGIVELAQQIKLKRLVNHENETVRYKSHIT